jgi:hypothetical protein
MNYENDFTNEFSVYLNSAQALTGPTTPKNCIFSIGSVLNQAPNIQNFQNCAYCKITLKYFSVFQTATQFKADGVTTLLIKLATAQQPNSIESVSVAGGQNSNFITSNIIGVVPTGNSDATYSNGDYDNSPFVISNPFSGDLHIIITDESGDADTPTITATDPWEAILHIEFPIKPSIKGITENNLQ